MQIITAETQINIEQHFKVVAGPGAGKTKFLVNHVKNVLTNSTRLSRNRKIACITYTNIGVDTLVNRIEDEKDHLEISTIHSFLFVHIIKPYLFLLKDKYGIDPAKFDIPFEHYFSNGYFSKTDLPRKYVTENDMKKNIFWEISGSECGLRIKNKKNIYHKSLLKYKSFFWEKGVMHYEDILAFAWEILNIDTNVVRILRAKFPYFFVDEFQDTSPIQTEILKKIAERETVVGVIGDVAQSIYNFQGASMQQFIDFALPSMNNFQIEDNWRSTNQIIGVLKMIRFDLNQRSPEDRNSEIPKLLIGDSIQALEYCDGLFGKDKVVSLSYMVPTANAMKKRINVESPANIFIEQIMMDDGDSERKKLFISVVKAIEFSKQFQFDEAIKEVSRLLKKTDDFKGRKNALILIKSLLNSYEDYFNGKLWDLYKKVIEFSFIDIKHIQERKAGNLTKVESLYRNTEYKDLALSIRHIKDESIHRTIHKAKGDEFENVLVVIKGEFGHKYKEDRDLKFLLDPDLINNEDHRVYYVACSRARENLLINIPEMTEDTRQKLSSRFQIIEVPIH